MSQWVTGSPIELFWTAKKINTKKQEEKKSGLSVKLWIFWISLMHCPIIAPLCWSHIPLILCHITIILPSHFLSIWHSGEKSNSSVLLYSFARYKLAHSNNTVSHHQHSAGQFYSSSSSLKLSANCNEDSLRDALSFNSYRATLIAIKKLPS